MFYPKSFLIFVTFFFNLIAATPVSVPDDAAVSENTRNWTYRDIYNYAIGKGGANDTTAHIIADHVNQTGRNWADTYRNDITWNNATLTLSHHVATLKERQVLPGTYLVFLGSPTVMTLSVGRGFRLQCGSVMAIGSMVLRTGCIQFMPLLMPAPSGCTAIRIHVIMETR